MKNGGGVMVWRGQGNEANQEVPAVHDATHCPTILGAQLARDGQPFPKHGTKVSIVRTDTISQWNPVGIPSSPLKNSFIHSSRRKGVLPKSSARLEVGRALRCAPPEVAKTRAFRAFADDRGAHGVRALPPKPFGQHARKEAQMLRKPRHSQSLLTSAATI